MNKDTRKEEQYDQWSQCWTTKNFPKDMIPASYSAWKRFLEYWFRHPNWTLIDAFNEYTR